MKLAVITGASSGIGREFARQLRERGDADAFWLVARRRDSMETLANELDCPARIITADLATDEGVDTLVRMVNEEKPEVHYLINAAGFGTFGGCDEVSDTQVSRMIDLNVKALVRITHAFVPYMIRGGHIIEMGSASAFTPLPYFNVYASGKAFVHHYTKALWHELRPLGISATCFAPGWVDTGFIGVAAAEEDVTAPKPSSYKPLLKVERVVRGALRAARRKKKLYVTNWFTKMQHILFKILPDGILTRVWMKRLNRRKK